MLTSFPDAPLAILDPLYYILNGARDMIGELEGNFGILVVYIVLARRTSAGIVSVQVFFKSASLERTSSISDFKNIRNAFIAMTSDVCE